MALRRILAYIQVLGLETYTLDRYDVSILSALQTDGRMSWVELGEVVSLSATAAQRRVRALENAGVIAGFTVALDSERLGHAVQAFVSVSIERRAVDLAAEFRNTVTRYPEVQSCYKLTGDVDFLLDIVAADIGSYAQFIELRILSLGAVRDASSAIVLETVKAPRTMIPST